MPGVPKILVLLTVFACSSLAQAQRRWEFFAGPQFDLLEYRGPEDTDDDPRTIISGEVHSTTDWGVYAGAAFMASGGVARLKGSIILSRQQVNSSYSRSSYYYWMAGFDSSSFTGEMEEIFTIMEFPLQVSIGKSNALRVDLGLAPWILLDVDKHDSGVEKSAWWRWQIGYSSSATPYDERSHDADGYSRAGLSGVCGLTATIKKRWLLSSSFSASVTHVYMSTNPFSGRHTLLRIGLGYALNGPAEE